ncbi:MAG: efflux RND transporter periplasmic adaptor subunit [Pseudomonadales bacterium]|nr:efflux RND transporter periplasmic adaptor subunit [Pseudomonadales bacterium]
MKIQQSLLLVSVFTSVLLTACNKAPEVERVEAIRPVKAITLADPSLGTERGFPAKIEAGQRASLSFRVPGQLVKLPVKEGDLVQKGQVLAELDPKDFQLQLADKKASFERATNDWVRGKELVKEGHMARSDFDRTVSLQQQAAADYKQAQLNLSYVILKAPFSGRVAKRLVENFAEVSAKQKIFVFRGASELEVRFDVPEQLMIHLKEQGGENKGLAYVQFPLAGKKRYAMTFKEVSAQADEDTQTFEVRFMLEKPENLNVLPGMSANVTVRLPQVQSDGWLVPDSALLKDGDSAQVWVFNAENHTATRVAVTVEPFDIGHSRIKSGVKSGDQIIVAGVHALTDGMKLYIMASPEQAEY